MKIVVVAKAPVAGRVKTRLCPPCGPADAARLAEAALEDTLAAATASGASACVLALDGQPGPWLPPGVDVVPQRAGGLADRLQGALDDAGGPALVIGMDTPQVTAADLDAALASLDRPGIDAVMGPATDGGWWALGVRAERPGLFDGVPMSTSRTGALQRRRLHDLGLRTRLLPVQRDVDTVADAAAVAAASPGTRFAVRFRNLAALRPGLQLPVLRTMTGEAIPLAVDRWASDADAVDHAVLERAAGPVLDVGCGPGRHVAALAERGVVALGIDASGTATRLAEQRGVPVLERSVFDRVPGAGRWRTALLLDGNIGIGGRPALLLRRIFELLQQGGGVLVEVEPPGSPTESTVARVECAGERGPWFRWAVVGADDIASVAAAAGASVDDLWEGGHRWFAFLAGRR